jgi:hypothetical protein
MKKLAWGVFWIYQIAGCVVAVYYWEEIRNHYHLMVQLTEEFLR